MIIVSGIGADSRVMSGGVSPQVESPEFSPLESWRKHSSRGVEIFYTPLLRIKHKTHIN